MGMATTTIRMVMLLSCCPIFIIHNGHKDSTIATNVSPCVAGGPDLGTQQMDRSTSADHCCPDEITLGSSKFQTILTSNKLSESMSKMEEWNRVLIYTQMILQHTTYYE